MSIFKRLATIAVVTCVAVGAAACGQWAPSLPSSPSGVPSPLDSAPSNGATIQGRVNGTSVGISPTLSSVTTSLTVTIVGTNISAPVSSSGAFLLEGVPAGNIQLQFTSSSGGAIATLGSVNSGDRIDVKIRLVGSVGVIEARIRIAADNTTEVEGDVVAISGSCPNLTFVVNGWTLKVDSSSQGGCADIKIGIKVKIKGTLSSGKVVIVVRIKISGNHTDDDDDSDSDSDSDK